MATATHVAFVDDKDANCSHDRQLDAYRNIALSRHLDERGITLKQQNKSFFQLSSGGHEAVQTAAGHLLCPGRDWVFPYYRDRALCLALGLTPLEMLLQEVGAADDPMSGGRQMPAHWSSTQLNIVSASSSTGTQFLQAVGCAHASRLAEARDEITLVCAGDGATSQGEFWEALNAACLERLPVVFLIEDNGYAISVPIERQTAGGSISQLVRGWPNLHTCEFDGIDYLESYRHLEAALVHCRGGDGPALVHAHVVRLSPHSMSDDHTLYRPDHELQSDVERDPLRILANSLLSEGKATPVELAAIDATVISEVDRATENALRSESPSPSSIFDNLYSPTFDPSSMALRTPPTLKQSPPLTFVDSINRTLADEMQADERIVVFGEDVADCSREKNLTTVPGKGGVFKATKGLQREFGGERVFNSPLAEAGIVGRAIGMAVRGLKPVVEIQFFDYIWPAMMQIRNELALLRWRSAGGFAAPVVIRVPIGGYLGGGSIYHSQSGESIFSHIPGLRVVMPSNAGDAVGLLRTAIRCDDPVLFLEPKKLYRETYNRSPYPGTEYMIPFGSARIVRPGSDVTLLAYGSLVRRAELAADRAAREHAVDVEVIDLRSLAPYDWETIAESVRRSNRILIAHEDCISFGYGSEIAARVANELFDHLDAPVARIGAKDTWVGYHPDLEAAVLPQVNDIVDEIGRLAAF